jgi:AraC family transcriptional activator of tynA and feaB
METYSTSGLPAGSRASAWNELYSSRLASVDFMPADRYRFKAELRLSRLGPIGIARMTSDRISIVRTSRHISQGAKRLYSFVLQARGNGVFSHCGHEAVLEEGDFVLCDSSAPHLLRVGDDSEIVMLRVPANLLQDHLPSPELFCGRRLNGTEGLAGTAGTMALSLCKLVEGGLSPDYESRIARHLLEVMATSYTIAFDPLVNGSAVVTGWHARVKRYIEEHLRDPTLTACAVATALKMSPRYLRMIFSISDETMSAYVLRRRLEESARQICDPSWRGHTITEIAFSWGFNSAAHFARSFRERFDMAPRDYRRLRLG